MERRKIRIIKKTLFQTIVVLVIMYIKTILFEHRLFCLTSYCPSNFIVLFYLFYSYLTILRQLINKVLCQYFSWFKSFNAHWRLRIIFIIFFIQQLLLNCGCYWEGVMLYRVYHGMGDKLNPPKPRELDALGP